MVNFSLLCVDIQETRSEQEGRRAGQNEGKVWTEYTGDWQKMTVSLAF